MYSFVPGVTEKLCSKVEAELGCEQDVVQIIDEGYNGCRVLEELV